jgi:hypothetical protein
MLMGLGMFYSFNQEITADYSLGARGGARACSPAFTDSMNERMKLMLTYPLQREFSGSRSPFFAYFFWRSKESK